MNELALKICKQYIDGLVEALEVGADIRAKFGAAVRPGFLTDINGTLDMPYSGRDNKRLLDIFLADVKDAGGEVRANSGIPGQSLPGYELPEAFKRNGETLEIEPKPLKDWKSAPPIVIDDEELIRNFTEARGGVAIDPLDPDFEEFLEGWHDLKADLDEHAWKAQRAELLAPFVGR